MASRDKGDGGIVETIKTVFWALVIAIAFRSILFQPFWIPSESMKDTLLIGDFLFVNKMAYGYSRYSCEIPFTTISLCPVSGRVLGSTPSGAMWSCSGIRRQGRITSSGWSVCRATRCRCGTGSFTSTALRPRRRRPASSRR
jgi:hypothetical protein